MVVSKPTPLKLTPLKPEYFQSLLSRLDKNREEAGRIYLIQRQNVTRIFTQAGCEYIEELTDETFHRVGKYLAEGKEIQNVKAFTKTTTRLVLHEYWREINKSRQTVLPVDNDIDHLINKNTQEESVLGILQEIAAEKDERLIHLRVCLDTLTKNIDEKRMILGYYYDEKKAYKLRKKIADFLGITPNTLSTRVSRLRVKLFKCINDCMKKEVR